MDRKIIHLVVQYNPGFGHEDLGTETGVNRQGACDGVAETVKHAKMCRSTLLCLKIPQTIILCGVGLDRRNPAANPRGIVLGHQCWDRRFDKIRIAEILRAVRERVLHCLGNQLKVGRRVGRKLG